MNREYKKSEISEYLEKAPAFGGIAFGLFELMEFMNKYYQRLSDRLKSQAQFHRGRSHLGHHNRVSPPGVVNPK